MIDITAEFEFMTAYATENCFDEEICRDHLRMLWTVFCLHHGLDVDTHDYDCYLSELWRTVEKFEQETPDWSDFDNFELFMGKYLV